MSSPLEVELGGTSGLEAYSFNVAVPHLGSMGSMGSADRQARSFLDSGIAHRAPRYRETKCAVIMTPEIQLKDNNKQGRDNWNTQFWSVRDKRS